jgi:hypothetical protein
VLVKPREGCRPGSSGPVIETEEGAPEVFTLPLWLPEGELVNVKLLGA